MSAAVLIDALGLVWILENWEFIVWIKMSDGLDLHCDCFQKKE